MEITVQTKMIDASQENCYYVIFQHIILTNVCFVRISKKSLIVPADKLIFSPPGLMVVLIVLLAGYLCLGNKNRLLDKKCENVVPGPRPWPVIGSLHLMANFTKYPFEAFTNLQKVIERKTNKKY